MESRTSGKCSRAIFGKDLSKIGIISDKDIGFKREALQGESTFRPRAVHISHAPVKKNLKKLSKLI